MPKDAAAGDDTAGAVTADAATLAQRLLDAQVAWVVGELSGKRFAAMVARDVDDFLEVGSSLVLADVVAADTVKAVARRLVDVIGGSAVVADMGPAASDALYDLAASDEQLLGEVISRDTVDALVAKLLGMHQLQDRAMERLTESPLVASIASRYVTKLVGDFLQQNRERAEKLPGVSSLFSLGLGAASKVRGATDQFLGDAQARSAQFAMRRSNSAMREMIRDAPVHEAVMEVWDLQAAEPVGELRAYLTAQDLRELLAIVHELVTTARNHEFTGLLIDECIDVFFTKYGALDVVGLLAELGIDRAVIVDEILAFAPPVIKSLRDDGRLDALVRARLEPFYSSEATLALLAGTEVRRPKPPKPAKK